MKFGELSSDEIPSILVGDGNLLGIIANCYVFCRRNHKKLSDVRRVDTMLRDLYLHLVTDLEKWLSENRDANNSLLVPDWTSLRDHLKAGTLDELLVRAAAMLRACTWHAEPGLKGQAAVGRKTMVTTSTSLDSKEFLLAYVDNPIPGADAPRRENRISETMREYHMNLEITPRIFGPYTIEPISLPMRTQKLLEKRLKSDSLRIAAAPLNVKVAPKFGFLPWLSDKDEKRFYFETIGNEQAQRDEIRKVLDECIRQNISILVLPELRMPPSLCEMVRDTLRAQDREDLKNGNGLIMVVCGSWHVVDNGVFVNRSSVLDQKGDEIWTHDKLAEYHITRENVAGSPELQAAGFNHVGGVEAIRNGSRVEICDCALGRISVAICVGFFWGEIRNVLVASGATLFLVPAMSRDVTLMQDRAKDLATTQHATVVVANCSPFGIARDEKERPFYRLPKRKLDALRVATGEDLWILELRNNGVRVDGLTIN